MELTKLLARLVVDDQSLRKRLADWLVANSIEASETDSWHVLLSKLPDGIINSGGDGKVRVTSTGIFFDVVDVILENPDGGGVDDGVVEIVQEAIVRLFDEVKIHPNTVVGYSFSLQDAVIIRVDDPVPEPDPDDPAIPVGALAEAVVSVCFTDSAYLTSPYHAPVEVIGLQDNVSVWFAVPPEVILPDPAFTTSSSLDIQSSIRIVRPEQVPSEVGCLRDEAVVRFPAPPIEVPPDDVFSTASDVRLAELTRLIKPHQVPLELGRLCDLVVVHFEVPQVDVPPEESTNVNFVTPLHLTDEVEVILE